MVKLGFKAIKPVRPIVNVVKLIQDLREYERKWAETVIKKAQVYPPPPAGSKYKRTQRFHDSWEQDAVVFESGNLVVRLRNTAVDPRGRRYGGYVMNDVRAQAKVHKGRWKKLTQLAREDRFEAGAQKVITANLR